MNGIRIGQQVLGSDGGMIGVVDRDDRERIRIHSTVHPQGHYFIRSEWVARVDDHVHLSLPAATARDRWVGDTETVSASAWASGDVTGEVDRKEAKRNLPMIIIGIIFLLAILVFAVRSCGYAVDESTNTEQALPSADSDATGTGAANGQ
ncbi:DUF2171 domain-containing protein [Allosphingosinicella vermicomposti]|uniref:DUF2171 domain-containing protein n=1 Tax=Allosphingosinicella vermicomposti TaxID=614671 RepID=UPI000D0F1FA8|nr:DUF2171 domain-containing protein [Allosphingosinicella vermicomposti]